MFHIVRTIGGGEELARAASAVLLNMLFEVDGVATTVDAPTLGAAAVHLASVVLDCADSLKSSGDKKWWEVLGFDFAVMEALELRYLKQKESSMRH
jgi:hypothetical protein